MKKKTFEFKYTAGKISTSFDVETYTEDTAYRIADLLMQDRYQIPVRGKFELINVIEWK